MSATRGHLTNTMQHEMDGFIDTALCLLAIGYVYYVHRKYYVCKVICIDAHRFCEFQSSGS